MLSHGLSQDATSWRYWVQHSTSATNLARAAPKGLGSKATNYRTAVVSLQRPIGRGCATDQFGSWKLNQGAGPRPKQVFPKGTRWASQYPWTRKRGSNESSATDAAWAG